MWVSESAVFFSNVLKIQQSYREFVCTFLRKIVTRCNCHLRDWLGGLSIDLIFQQYCQLLLVEFVGQETPDGPVFGSDVLSTLPAGTYDFSSSFSHCEQEFPCGTVPQQAICFLGGICSRFNLDLLQHTHGIASTGQLKSTQL